MCKYRKYYEVMINYGRFIVLPDFTIGLNLCHVIYHYIKHGNTQCVGLLSPHPEWERAKGVCE